MTKALTMTRVPLATALAALMAILLLGQMLTAPANATAAKPLPGIFPMVSPGFRISASNGYEIYGFAVRDAGLLLVGGPGGQVAYEVPEASFSDESRVVMKLGRLGSVDLTFVPDGGAEVVKSSCGGFSPRVATGEYQGTFSFVGEEEYARAAATQAEVDLQPQLDEGCLDGGETQFTDAPGGKLSVEARRGPFGWGFLARKNGPRRPAYFGAYVSERSEGISITRTIGAVGRLGAFRYNRSRGLASVHPPAPFSGSATFRRGRSQRWQGSLAADFPGRSRVPLVRKGAEATLIGAQFDLVE